MKIFIRALCLILAVLTVFPLAACTQSSPAYATLGSHTITEAMYTYWLAYYKTHYYLVFKENGFVTDEDYTPEFWDTSLSGDISVGKTVEDYVSSVVRDFIIAAYLFDELELGKIYSEKYISSSVDEFITEDISAVGSRSELNRQLGEIGINVTTLKKIYTLEAKCMLVEEYLFGEDGEHKVTDEFTERFYQENYHRVKHVLIDTRDKLVLDDDGNPIMDTYTGYYKTEPLTDAEIEEKTKLASAILNNAKAGASFEELIKTHGEDPGAVSYEDGYFLHAASLYEEAFLKASLEMEVGEIRMVKSEYGYHIIKKYPLEAGMWAKKENADLFSDLSSLTAEAVKEEFFSKYDPEISYNETDVSLKDIPMLSEQFVSSGM